MKKLETKGRSRKQRHHLFHNEADEASFVGLFVHQYDQYQYWKYDGAGSNGSAVGKE